MTQNTKKIIAVVVLFVVLITTITAVVFLRNKKEKSSQREGAMGFVQSELSLPESGAPEDHIEKASAISDLKKMVPVDGGVFTITKFDYKEAKFAVTCKGDLANARKALQEWLTDKGYESIWDSYFMFQQ